MEEELLSEMGIGIFHPKQASHFNEEKKIILIKLVIFHCLTASEN